MRQGYFNDLGKFLSYVDRRRRRWEVFKSLVSFGFFLVATSVFLNFSAFLLQAEYTLFPSSRFSSKVATLSHNPVSETTPSSTSSAYGSLLPPDVPTSGITIGKIGVTAPIIFGGKVENMEDLLRQGVVHIAGTALPGEPGNVFLTGHSSDVPWSPNPYKTVFALLNKLENGDEIGIRYGGQDLVYKVYAKEVVSKNEVGRFVVSDKPENLTLMTCYPIGTNWRRIIVQAERMIDDLPLDGLNHTD